MHNEFIIREALARDLDALVGLLGQLFAIENDFAVNGQKQRHGCAALMADHNRSIIKVAEARQTVVGMCTAQIVISTAEGGMGALVEDMVVDAAWRGRGIGTSLLRAVTSWATDHQCVRMQLAADKRNDAALEFYRRAGWHETNMVCRTKKIYEGMSSSPAGFGHVSMSTRR